MPIKPHEVPNQICLCLAEAIQELPIPESDDKEKWTRTLAKLERRLQYLAERGRCSAKKGEATCVPVAE
jgi:hypothetical protein